MNYQLMLSSIRPRLGHTFIARLPGWDASKFIYLVPGSTFTVSRLPLSSIFTEGTVVNYAEHVDVHTYDDVSGHCCAVYQPTEAERNSPAWLVSAGKNS
jgi:hypothetical protein